MSWVVAGLVGVGLVVEGLVVEFRRPRHLKKTKKKEKELSKSYWLKWQKYEDFPSGWTWELVPTSYTTQPVEKKTLWSITCSPHCSANDAILWHISLKFNLVFMTQNLMHNHFDTVYYK